MSYNWIIPCTIKDTIVYTIRIGSYNFMYKEESTRKVGEIIV